MHKSIIAIIMLSSITSVSFSFPDPIEFENFIANNATSVNSASQLLNQAQQIQYQFQNIQYQVQNLHHVNDYQWQNITGLMQQLDAISQQGQALSYASSNLDQQFKQKYPDYANSPQNTQNYQQAYKQWNVTTMDTIHDTMKSDKTTQHHSKTEQQKLSELQLQGKTAQGRMQILQVSSEISAQNVNQLQELKSIVAAQANAENAFMAYKVSKDSYTEKSIEDLVGKAPKDVPQYKNNPKLGEIATMGGQ